MERQDPGMDTEQRVAAQNFDVPILKAEGVMRSYDRGVEEGFVVRCIPDDKVGHGDDTDGW